jgi:hypothetical protein
MKARMNAKVVCALMIVASLSSVNAQVRSPSWQLTPLYTFHGQADGAIPVEVSLDPAGNLYGTTEFGGTSNCSPPLSDADREWPSRSTLEDRRASFTPLLGQMDTIRGQAYYVTARACFMALRIRVVRITQECYSS